jgi:predicted dithiol-disulfide oxidoreductase (DUF899 family)
MTTQAVSREDWLAARKALLTEEKVFMKTRDALSAKRRNLPRYRIEKDYVFDGGSGKARLQDLSHGKSQLIIYHFMFGADWQQGCKSCSFWADHFDGMAPHLAARDVAFACVSIAPLEKLLAFKSRMGWAFDWYSSAGTSFNEDFGVTGQPGQTLVYNYDKPKKDAGELPGLSVFARADGGIYHTYSCYARGLDNLNGTYQMLDLVPKGRDEDSLEWPMAWVKHHDRYGEPQDS